MSSIWHQTPNLDIINDQMNKNTIVEWLGIQITEVVDDFLSGTMPPDSRNFPPSGVVLGGPNVVLAATLGSIA